MGPLQLVVHVVRNCHGEEQAILYPVYDLLGMAYNAFKSILLLRFG